MTVGATPEPDDSMAPRKGTARASVALASGTIVSRILGFARTLLLAATIGTATNAADAFGIANQLPNTMYELTAGGILTAILVPQIVQATRASDGGSAYINRISTLAILLFTGSAAIVTAAAPLLISLYTRDWPPDRVALATGLAYLCLPQIFFYGLYALLGGVLNARSVFGPYTWAPVLNNVIAIAGLVVFLLLFGADGSGLVPIADWNAQRIGVLAGSATLGVAAQALILFVFWHRAGIRFRPNFTFRGVGLGPTFIASGWILGNVLVEAIVGLVQANVLTFAASARTAGEVTLVGNNGYATVFLLFVLPHSIIAVSISTVYFTRLSQHWSTHTLSAFRSDFSHSARLIGLANVLCTALLAVLSFPLVRLFSTGDFGLTEALARILLAMSVGLVAYSFYFLVMRALYSVDDTRSVFLIEILSAGIRIPISIAAMLFSPYWIAIAMAGLTAATMWVEAIIGFFVLRRRVGPLDGRTIVRTHARLVGAALSAALVGAAAATALGAYSPGGFGNATILGALATMAIVGTIMVLTYGGMLRVLRVRELDGLRALLMSRIVKHVDDTQE